MLRFIFARDVLKKCFIFCYLIPVIGVNVMYVVFVVLLGNIRVVSDIIKSSGVLNSEVIVVGTVVVETLVVIIRGFVIFKGVSGIISILVVAVGVVE